MRKEIRENELNETAMQIILHAGDARIEIQRALDLAKQFEFVKSRKALEEARECVCKAHQSQTNVIQDEARGKSYKPSLLFNHAQDTLMTIMTELNLSKELIDFFEILSER